MKMMRRDELIRSITSSSCQVKFWEIPPIYRDNQILQLWLESSCGSLRDFPKEFLSDDLRRVAVSLSLQGTTTDQFPLAFIKKEDTEHYEEIALLAIKNNGYNMLHVDPSIHSEAFFLKALAANSKALVQFIDGYKGQRGTIAWTEAVIDAAVSKDVAYLMLMDSSLIKMECVETMIQAYTAPLTQLANIGLIPVMSEMMNKGLWWSSVPKPASLAECLDSMSATLYMPPFQDKNILYKAYALSFPKESVLPMLNQPGREALMFELYTHEELVELLKGGLLNEHKHIKGRLLEEEMGL